MAKRARSVRNEQVTQQVHDNERGVLQSEKEGVREAQVKLDLCVGNEHAAFVTKEFRVSSLAQFQKVALKVPLRFNRRTDGVSAKGGTADTEDDSLRAAKQGASNQKRPAMHAAVTRNVN